MMGLTESSKDCVQVLYDLYKSKGDTFNYSTSKFYLNLTDTKLAEISQSFNDSTSIDNFKQVFFTKPVSKEYTFDNQMNKNLDQKNYTPMFVDLDIAKDADLDPLERF